MGKIFLCWIFFQVKSASNLVVSTSFSFFLRMKNLKIGYQGTFQPCLILHPPLEEMLRLLSGDTVFLTDKR
jgi:hypothetical protein